MEVDGELGAVHLKIAIVSGEPGVAASLVRKVAAKTPRSRAGKLVEPENDASRRAASPTGALVAFDYYLPELKLASGALAHPRLYALDTRAGAVVTDAAWAALLHDADAILRLGASFTALELALRLAPSVEVHAAKADEGALAIRRVVKAALASAEVSTADERGGETVSVATITCPWCLEPVEITIEADVEGTYVQDCEVCCRPWTMHVGHDEDGELSVDVDRA